MDSKELERFSSQQLEVKGESGYRCLSMDYVTRGDAAFLVLIVVNVPDGQGNSFSATIRPESIIVQQFLILK